MNNNFKLNKKNQTVTIFPISDVHVGTPQFNQEFYEYMLEKFRKKNGCKIIYLMGDLMDCATKRLGKSAYEQILSPEEQLDYIVNSLKPYKKFIRGCVIGNHECFDEDTEILTIKGWKKGIDLQEEDLIGTFNQETKEIEYQKPLKINIEYVKENLISLKSRSIDTLTTSNHRFLYTTSNDERTLNNMRLSELKNIKNSEIVLRQACENNKKSYDLNDDEIKLIAWCLTDASFYKNKVVFYQRKSTVYKIIEILKNLNIKYTIRERDRDITHICGKKLKNKPEIACEVTINKSEINHLCESHTKIPKLIYELSKRQFLVFLDELIFCDGSKHKSSPNNSWVLYKNKEFLDEIQILCIHNNIRTSLSKYRENHYRLNINPKFNRSRIKNKQEEIYYDGLIWCATVQNDTLITRRNGKVIITGNSRFRKEFDLDIMKILADQLDTEYTKEIYDKLIINDQDYYVWANHGSKTSQQLHLMMGAVQRQTEHIDANLYLYGHAHYCANWSQTKKIGDDYKRKHYVLTGHYLNYENSYAQEKMLKPSLPSFSKVNIDHNLRTSVELYSIDECKIGFNKENDIT